MIDGTKQAKSVSLAGHRQIICGVTSDKAKPHTLRVCGVSGIVPRLGSRGMENLVT